MACYGNSMVETLFKTIKSELIWPVAWQSGQQAENAVARYIDGFRNPVDGIHRSASKAPSPSSQRAKEVR
jgi:putative transposase